MYNWGEEITWWVCMAHLLRVGAARSSTGPKETNEYLKQEISYASDAMTSVYPCTALRNAAQAANRHPPTPPSRPRTSPSPRHRTRPHGSHRPYAGSADRHRVQGGSRRATRVRRNRLSCRGRCQPPPSETLRGALPLTSANSWCQQSSALPSSKRTSIAK